MDTTIFEYKPIEEFIAMVKGQLKTLDSQGLVEDLDIISSVMYCNDKLGVSIQKIQECIIPIEEFRGIKPRNFQKIYYLAALTTSNTMVANMRNPFDNNFDRRIIYDVKVDRGSFGCADCYNVTINRGTDTIIQTYHTWYDLGVSSENKNLLHMSSPNGRRTGKYTVKFEGDDIITPFRRGELYMMYISNMSDNEGNLLFPFHPLVTPWYLWYTIEQIVTKAAFNSDLNNGDLPSLATRNKSLAWLDAYNFTQSEPYNTFLDKKRKRELGWYNKYFKLFQ